MLHCTTFAWAGLDSAVPVMVIGAETPPVRSINCLW